MQKIYVFLLALMVLFLGTSCNKQERVMPDTALTYSSVKINKSNLTFPSSSSSAREKEPGCYGVSWDRGDGEDIEKPCKHGGSYCSFFFGLCFKINNYRGIGPGNPNPGQAAYVAILTIEDQNTNAMINEKVFLVDRFILPPTVNIPKHLVMKGQYLHYSAKDQGYHVILKEL